MFWYVASRGGLVHASLYCFLCAMGRPSNLLLSPHFRYQALSICLRVLVEGLKVQTARTMYHLRNQAECRARRTSPKHSLLFRRHHWVEVKLAKQSRLDETISIRIMYYELLPLRNVICIRCNKACEQHLQFIHPRPSEKKRHDPSVSRSSQCLPSVVVVICREKERLYCPRCPIMLSKKDYKKLLRGAFFVVMVRSR